MSPLSQKFARELAQQSDALQHLAGDTTLNLFYPQPFTASATLCLSNSPWYLDYGHLSFWFFFFATFSIVLWLTYLFIALSRNVESRRVVRETRGFSRAQTGDTMTAVLPLTWSVTMLAHAGTHSSNFDENTNAAAFSFTVTAYQWGWNYLFPREIGDLLSEAPRFVGRGHVLYPRRGDVYGLLLARARHDFLQGAQVNGRYTAQHGRLTPALPLQILLPTLAAESAELPAWVATGAPFIANYTPTPSTESTHLVPFGTADLATSNAAFSLRGLLSPSRSCQLALDQAATGRTDRVARVGVSWAHTFGPSAPVGTVLLTPQTRLSTPSLAAQAFIGNRLNLVHLHLAAGPGALRTRTAALLSRSLALDPKLTLVSSTLWSKHPGEVITLGNLRAVGSSDVGGEGSLWQLPLPNGSAQFDHPSFALLSVPNQRRWGASLLTPTAAWAAFRGQALGLLGGYNSALTPADHWANTNAAIAELGYLSTFKGGCFFSTTQGSSSRLALTAQLLPQTWGSTAFIPAVWSAVTALTYPLTLSYLTRQPLITPVPLTLGRQTLEFVSTWSTNRTSFLELSQFHLERWSSRELFSQKHRPRCVGSFQGLEASQPVYSSCFFSGVHSRPLTTLGLRTSSLPSDCPLNFLAQLESFPIRLSAFLPLTVWLEGADLAQPLRTSAPAVGESIQINSRLGGPDLAQSSLTTALPERWRCTWSWYVMAAAFPWDRLYRAQLSRRPVTGIRPDFAPSVGPLSGPEILSLQRQRFDKNFETTLLSSVEATRHAFFNPELGRAVLDSSSGALLLVAASTLPAPHLDLDPAFIQARWSGELSVSRRSDHDSKFSLSWGPVVTGLGALTLEAPTLSPWVGSFDPRALNPQVGTLAPSSAFLAQRSLAAVAVTPAPIKQTLQFWAGLPSSFGFISVKGGLTTRNLLQVGLQSLWSVTAVPPASVLSWFFTPRRPHVEVRNLANFWAFKPSFAVQTGAPTPSHVLWGAELATTRLLLSHTLYGQVLSFSGAGLRLPKLPVLPQTTDTLSQVGRLERSGFLPLNTDVSAQRRLRVTKGVYLPSDTPMHGIFGSKDVIHSWAIPALGVKIDCIPGFSSHRRLVLRWRGLYWGQCMEVCGRYHHWMPILIRVVHKDVFLLWCLAHIRLLNPRSGSVNYTISLETARTLLALASQPAISFERA